MYIYIFFYAACLKTRNFFKLPGKAVRRSLETSDSSSCLPPESSTTVFILSLCYVKYAILFKCLQS